MAPWLRDQEYGKVFINNNPLLQHTIPIDCLPPNAADVNIRWVIGNTFYVLDFRVSEGLPKADFDAPHKGRRGGTPRTRYYGRLEGVTPEAKALAERAAGSAGVSIHEWLDAAVRHEAAKTLSAPLDKLQ
jgi:hypothetical protein